MSNDNNDEFIYRYSRAQAIEDGMLVDVTEMAKEAGIAFPTALSIGVFGEVVECSEEDEAAGQDEKGRMWDILMVLRVAAKSTDGPRVDFKVLVYKDGQQVEIPLYALCGPGDTPEPVITVMLPHED